MYNYTYLCAYQILMIAILTKWLPLYKNNDIGEALGKACEQDCDTEAVHLARAAQIVRRYMFEDTDRFSGPFQGGCQEDYVPNVLVAMINMVLDGTSIKNQSLLLRHKQLFPLRSFSGSTVSSKGGSREQPRHRSLQLSDRVRLKKLLFQPTVCWADAAC